MSSSERGTRSNPLGPPGYRVRVRGAPGSQVFVACECGVAGEMFHNSPEGLKQAWKSYNDLRHFHCFKVAEITMEEARAMYKAEQAKGVEADEK